MWRYFVPVSADNVRRLFERLVALATPYPELGRALEPRHAIFGGVNLTFEGEAYDVFQQLTHDLVDHGLAQGGPNHSTVKGWLAYACRVGLDQGAEAGFAELTRLVEEPLRHWTVLESIRGHFAKMPLRVGRCVVYSTLESVPQVGTESNFGEMLAMDTPPPVLATEVLARDSDSALIRAKDQFAESRAVLHLAAELVLDRSTATTVLDEHGDATTSAGAEERFVMNRLADGPRLMLGYQGLEAAAAEEPLERNDWESRVLAAARWHRSAVLSEWPSESVAAAMSALECLFIGGTGVTRYKGKALADHVFALASINGMNRDEARAWFVGLYRRRNDALHEGLWMRDDLDAERLVRLSKELLRWASFHLDEDHVHLDPGRACTSREEALSGTVVAR